ncbi:hypothetical protein RRG08_016104 [Elysia crispata]|uniref:Uncharacterized protein n=1 Tax=Elysia crispata TaxID=231223 RepID=A0AAE1DKF6_9GAST|nr:hypothetical protein RRG08_016104 [Elysia crispata]
MTLAPASKRPCDHVIIDKERDDGLHPQQQPHSQHFRFHLFTPTAIRLRYRPGTCFRKGQHLGHLGQVPRLMESRSTDCACAMVSDRRHWRSCEMIHLGHGYHNETISVVISPFAADNS